MSKENLAQVPDLPELSGDGKRIKESYRKAGLVENEIDEMMEDSHLVLYSMGEDCSVSDYLAVVPPEPEGTKALEVLPVLATQPGVQFDAYEVARYIADSRAFGYKQAGYLLRSYPGWGDEVGQEKGQKVVGVLERGLNNMEKKIFSQYLPVIQELVPEESEILEKINSKFTNDSSKARAAATTPVEDLPFGLENFPEQANNKAAEIEGIYPRLRGLKGARDCGRLESRHYNTFLDEDPTKETVLIRLDDRLVGSWKEQGQNSLLALHDVVRDGKYLLRKGWTYKSTWNLWKTRHEAEEIEGWSILDVDELPIDPLRPAGEEGNKSEEWWRENIDERVEKLEQEIF